MDDSVFKYVSALDRKSTGHPSDLILTLAEAGAKGYFLNPLQVKKVCEAYCARCRESRTHFHSGN